MATPTIQQGRLITKRSAIPGTVPTVPAVDDIETFTPTDIFKGELFYNIPDNILYTRDNTGIIIISSGGAPIPYVYYTENTGVGTEEGKIEIVNGTITSKVDVLGSGLVQLNCDDGSLPSSSNIYVSPSGIGVNTSDGTVNSGLAVNYNNTTLESQDGLANSAKVYLTAVGDAELTATNGTNINSFYAQSSGGVISKAYDGSGNNSDVNIQYGSITEKSTDGTNQSQIFINPTAININSFDGLNNNILSISPTNIKHSSIEYINYSKTTNNATPFTYVLYNIIGLSRVFNIKIRAIGISGTTAYGAEMFGIFVFDSGSSTVTQVSTTDLVEKSTFTTATIDFSTSSQFINLVITGELATTIDWRFEIEIFE